MIDINRKKEAVAFCKSIGHHIRALREERGIKVAEIAFKAGIDTQNLRKYELGKQEMKISMLKRVVEAFDMTLVEFFDGLSSDYSE